jgi:hypothetical protein
MLPVSLACWPVDRGHHGVALVVPCRAAPRARALPRGGRPRSSRPVGGPVRLVALAAALLPLTLRSECPLTATCAGLGGRVQAHAAVAQSSPTIAHLAWPINEHRVALMFPPVLPTRSPGLSCRLSRPPWRLPYFPCRPAMDCCRPHLAVLASCLCGSSIAVISPTSPYSQLKWWSPHGL